MFIFLKLALAFSSVQVYTYTEDRGNNPGKDGTTMANNMKKDFQNMVKAFRDTLPDVVWISQFGESLHRPEYPKAMMTEQQMRKGTATINCSYGKNAKERAEAIKTFPAFIAWCESYGIKSVTIETVNNPYGEVMQYQIRVTY